MFLRRSTLVVHLLYTVTGVVAGTGAQCEDPAAEELAPQQPHGWLEEIGVAAQQHTLIECNIDQVDRNIDAAIFFREYARPGRPAIIRGAATHWPAFSRWSRAYLEAGLSGRGRQLRAGTQSEVAVGGYPERNATAEAILRDKMLIAFDADVLRSDSGSDLRADVPSMFSTIAHFAANLSMLTLSLGGSGTGVSFHYHQENWIALFAGRKRWLLYDFKNWNALQDGSAASQHRYVAPVGNSTDTDCKGQVSGVELQEATKNFTEPPMVRWAREELPNAWPKPWQCLQQPGDVLYIPDHWLHGTINVGETLGVVARRNGPPAEVLVVDETAAREHGVLKFLCNGKRCPDWTGLS